MKCQWPQDGAAVGLEYGRMEDGTGGTEIGVDTTRVVMHIIHRDIAGEIAALQTMHMWAVPVVDASRQKTD